MSMEERGGAMAHERRVSLAERACFVQAGIEKIDCGLAAIIIIIIRIDSKLRLP